VEFCPPALPVANANPWARPDPLTSTLSGPTSSSTHFLHRTGHVDNSYDFVSNLLAGRSESTNLQGATAGVFAAKDTHLRRTFTTTVSLRNQLGTAQETAFGQGVDGYN